ncbi:MAG: PQQ-dependent sugar dehydrogenase [Saprospiraceae bacterium]
MKNLRYSLPAKVFLHAIVLTVVWTTAGLLLSPLSLLAQPKIQLTNFATGFDLPVDITHCGDSRLFVVERKGLIWVLDSLGNRLDTFLNIDPRVNSTQSEQGLLGLAFDPNYAQNGYFYVNYTKNGVGDTRVARFSVKPNNPNEANPNSELTIIEQSQPYWNHNGGCVKFGPDGYLYIALGDGGSGGDPQNYGQNKLTFLGKMLRIDVKNSNASQPYVLPPNNPFVGNAQYKPEIWSLGWRNPWRFSFDRLTGDKWIGDVGQNLWEEVDFEPANTPGLNYGWRCYEGLHPYNTTGCQPASAYVSPFFEYSHSGGNGCSVTGGFVYRGSQYPDLYGYYLFADYCSGRWWYTKRNTDGTFSTAILATLAGYEYSSFGENKDGELFVTLLSSGRVQRVKELCSPFQVSGMASPRICPGSMTGEINLSATGATGTVSYTWSNGATSQNLVGLGPGMFSVEAKDGNNCFRRDTFEIVEIGPENPSLSASDLTICTNGLVQLTASNLTASSTLTWYNGANIVATSNASGSTDTLGVTQPGDYSVIVNDSLCPASSSIVSIVKIGPDEPILTASDSVICANGSAILTASNLPLSSTLTWYNGTNIVATTNASASTAALEITQPGNYSVIVNDPICLVSSSIVGIVKVGPDNPNLSASATVICPTGTVQLTASNLPVPSTLSWYNGANIVAITNASASTATLEVTQPGDYSVIVNDPLCPATSTIVSVVLTGPDNPILTASDLVICTNGSAQLIASNLPVPSTLIWYNGPNIVATTLASASTDTLNITEPGNYSVVINDALCLAPSSIVSIVRIGPDSPILSASDLVICANGSVQLTASKLSAPSTLTWYNGANIVATTNAVDSIATLDITLPGDYFVVINDAFCSIPSSIVTVSRIGPDIPLLAASDSVICINGSVILTASNLLVPSTLTWFNGANIVATTNTTDSIATLEITEPGDFSVIISDGLCIVPSAFVSVVRVGPDNPSLSASDSVICINGSVILIANNLPVPSTLSWYNGTNIVATTYTLTPTAILNVTQPGDYSLVVNDSFCIASSAVVTVLQDTPILPLIESNYDSLYALSPCSACQWLFYGQPIPGATGMYHIATQEGIYSLQVTSPNGCQYISDEVFFLEGSSKLPNAVRRFSISPNPSEHTILLEMELEKNQSIKLYLTDSNQRQVFAKAVEGQKIVLPIDLSNLPAGTYFLTVIMENGSFVRKLVKK